jgi:hypothetical protein
MKKSRNKNPRPLKANPLIGLRFILERLVLRGLHYRLLLSAIIIGLVSLLGGILVLVFESDISEMGEAIWWAFLRLSDPGYLGDDEGLTKRAISTVITVLGYVLFLGFLVAILTQWMNQLIARLESGITPITLSDHILILGWTYRTPEVVLELLRAEGSAKRFLAKHSARSLRVVILAEEVTQELHQELREQLGDHWNDHQVLLRKGSSQRIDHLKRVAFDQAAALILPGADFGAQHLGVIDAETIKTLFSVSIHMHVENAHKPLAVAALYDADRSILAEEAYAGNVEVVAPEAIISKLIAQSIYRPGMWEVLQELWTFNQGNTLYTRACPELTGTPLGVAQSKFSKAIILGKISQDRHNTDLLSDPEILLSKKDQLIFIARTFSDCEPDGTHFPLQPRAAGKSRGEKFGQRRILILGWNRKVPPLVQELLNHGGEDVTVDIAGLTSITDREEMLSLYSPNASLRNVNHMELNFLVPDKLASQQPQSYDAVIVLAREHLGDNQHADASTVSTALALRSLLPEQQQKPHLLFELLDADNRFLFKEPQSDCIVSPSVTSYMLSQIALHSELAAVYSALSRAWGPELVLQPASDYLDLAEPVTFHTIQDAAHRRGEIAIGIQRRQGEESKLLLNPDRTKSWTLTTDDQVVLLVKLENPGSGNTDSGNPDT